MFYNKNYDWQRVFKKNNSKKLSGEMNGNKKKVVGVKLGCWLIKETGIRQCFGSKELFYYYVANVVAILKKY